MTRDININLTHDIDLTHGTNIVKWHDADMTRGQFFQIMKNLKKFKKNHKLTCDIHDSYFVNDSNIVVKRTKLTKI